jgi:hypothetical protein
MFYHREILLRAVFCGSGKVTDLVVTVGVNDALNEKAKAAAHRIKFSPAEKDGRQVSSVLVVKYVVR